ncbi:MAG TPA: antitoxin Xre/MbcA/ParS toxin-binding domain-containing protein [Woeseiaceae bacterium]|nr:antitoxin Xre/MbcA/ParS toxin-binding domain-containing protein [Woeseiaceae bacterium]
MFAHMSMLLDVKLSSESDAVRLATLGVSTRSYRRVARKLGIPPSLVAPESTVRRRLSTNARFSEAESERLIRLTRIYAEAVELFGNEQQALDWLNTPETFISGQPPVTPMQLAAKDSGARLLEAHIRRTAHGIF